MTRHVLPFVGRGVELQRAQSSLHKVAVGGESRALLILGDSGTGKTRLCKEVLARVLTDHPQALSLYTDLSADEFSSTNVLQILVSLAWRSCPFSVDHLVAVPEGDSLLDHVRSRNRRRRISRFVLSGVAEAVRAIPGAWSSLSALVPDLKTRPPDTLQAEDLAVVLFTYLEETAKKRPVFLILDNYQFLSHSLRVLLECRANALSQGLCFVTVIRTEDGETDAEPTLAFPGARERIMLRRVDRGIIREILRRGGITESELDAVAMDAALKTTGNLKELEYYFRSYLRTGVGDSVRSRIGSLLDSIARLPALERALVAVASLLPAGVELEHVRRIMHRMFAFSDEHQMEKAIDGLVAIGYLVINSTSGESLKPAHERVVQAVREGVTEEELLEIRESSVAAFEELLESQPDWRKRPYLLHCLVGLMSIHELRKRTGAVSALVDHQYREHNYAYITALLESFPGLPRLLPDAMLTMLLDSLQRTSEFYLGLEVVRELREARRDETVDLTLYEAKYLVQTYHAEKALQVLEGSNESDAVLLCRLNALQILSHDDEALLLIEDRQKDSRESESWAVALRNSAHLVDYSTALLQLRQAMEFFERTGSEYGVATVRNNLGVVSAWAGEYEDAERILEESADGLRRLASSEVYQPLINQSVLAYLRGRQEQALGLLDQASRWLPANLVLDQLVVEANRTVFEFRWRALSPKEAVGRFRTLLQESRRIQDPRLQNEIAYNLHRLEGHFAEDVTAVPEERFVRLFETRERTGFEVCHSAAFGGVELGLLVMLSPHWRH